MKRALASGALLGAAGGALTALADFGAHWLWLPTGADRVALLLTMLGLHLPLGSLAGLVIGAWMGATGRLVFARRPQQQDFVFGARLALLAAPALSWIAVLLFRGGRMSQLPAIPLLQTLTAIVLVASSAGAFALVHRIDRSAHSAIAPRTLAAAAIALGFALGKLDQRVLPGLYGYLHAALAASAWLAFMGGVAALARERLTRATDKHAAMIVTACVLIASGALAWTVLRLDRNQNVRVALTHPNAAGTRSLMQALGPVVLEPLERRNRQAARAALRRTHATSLRLAEGQGPVLQDAHVLLITIDALRADHLGAYGYARQTSPQLDQLAKESVVFEHAYAPAPHSSYSLCSLMTSEYLHETLDLGHAAPNETFATVAAAAGYHTAAFYTLGIFHTAAERLAQYESNAFGFALHDHVLREADALTDRVLVEVDRTIARGEPSSLLWVHYFDVHEPYEDTRFGTSAQDRYDGEIAKADAAVMRLIREARRRFTRDVVVVITADHGEEFREHGGVYHGSSLYEEQVRVPLLINAKGLAPRRVTAPVETLSIAPTALSLVGISPAASMRGDDLRGLASGLATDAGPVFAAVIHKKMVVRWPHKLIADLRFGQYELYDLSRDPRERENLAQSSPALLNELRGEVYGWLDSLAPASVGAGVDVATPVALTRGRLGDRRAVPDLIALARDTHAREADRAEAAQILGHLADTTAANALSALLADTSANVAAEAAIALGRMFDARAQRALRRLVAVEDPDVRTRAAVSLGRLRDRAAVPALIEALWIAKRDYEREEAVRWLGRLGDVQALEPLLQVLPERRTRHLAVVAIGRLGDPRAYDALLDVLRWETQADVRGATLKGLGYLGDTRALDVVLPLVAQDRSLAEGTETLVRLGALARGAVGGTDIVRDAAGLKSFSECFAGPPRHDWDYLHRTYCTTRSSEARLRVQLPPAVAVAAQGFEVALSARRSDAPNAATLHVRLGGHELPAIALDGSWSEHRWALPANALAAGTLDAVLRSDDASARFDVDHVLVLPVRATEAVAAP